MRALTSVIILPAIIALALPATAHHPEPAVSSPMIPSPDDSTPPPSPKMKALALGKVYIDVDERIEGKPKEELADEAAIAAAILQKMLTIHGYTRTKKRSRADWVITGKFDCAFVKEVEFRYGNGAVHLEYKFRSSGKLRVEAGEKQSLPDEAIPAVVELQLAAVEYGSSKRVTAQRDTRRLFATDAARRVLVETKLGDATITALIAELRTQPRGERTFNDVVDELVALGSVAVPYLLDELLLESPVRMPGELPGLTSRTRRGLCTYHIADRALRRLFGVDSELDLRSKSAGRIDAYRHWSIAWQHVQPLPKAYQFPEHAPPRK